jgi:hypothetical protein
MAMSNGTSARRIRRSRPRVEGLEGRALLSATSQNVAALQTTTTAKREKDFRYTANDGTHVDIHLYGAGGLEGTQYHSDINAVDILFSGTNAQSGIVAKVHGGSGQANLRYLLHASVSAQTPTVSGAGTTLINVVNLKDFNLVAGGRISLLGGVHVLLLNSVDPNTEVNLRELPESATPSTSTSASQNGVNLAFITDLTGAQTLTSLNGQFIPGFNLLATPSSQQGAPGSAPPGVVVSINHVNGPAHSGGLGAARIFGYDAHDNALYGFDINYKTMTGTKAVSIPLAGILTGDQTSTAGVTLSRNLGHLDVLVSDGANVYAFNALNGAAEGSFSTENLNPADPITHVHMPTELGTFDNETVLGIPGGGLNGLGTIQAIDVGKSLTTGQAVKLSVAVPNSNPPQTLTAQQYNSQRQFGLSGALAGIPGSNLLYAAGGGHFDTFQPNAFQFGVASLSQSSSAGSLVLNESTRAAVKDRKGNTIPTDAHGSPPVNPNGNLFKAMGNIDLNLGVVTGPTLDASNNVVGNNVTLYSPTSLSPQGTIALNDLNPLSDLSGTFYPNLGGSASPSTNVALINVLGNTQSFRAHDAQGLVFNGEGNVNLVKIDSATDTTILGFPFSHAEIAHRNNVLIETPKRSVGSRGDVVVDPTLAAKGPLSLP